MAQGKGIYPPDPLILNVFNYYPFADVKVVIIGQDPYHGLWHTDQPTFPNPSLLCAAIGAGRDYDKYRLLIICYWFVSHRGTLINTVLSKGF